MKIVYPPIPYMDSAACRYDVPMSHTIKDKSRLLARARRMEGQMQALCKALEAESPCQSILQQIASIRGAANGLMLEVLEGHITDHLEDPQADAQQRQQDTRQLIELLRSYIR